jgi:hypothetical protein
LEVVLVTKPEADTEEATQSPDAGETASPDAVSADAGTASQLLDAAIAAIIAETGCTDDEAMQVLAWIARHVMIARGAWLKKVYVSVPEQRRYQYQIFARIMPIGSTPAPGSAADLVEEYLLDREAGEKHIGHSTEDEHDIKDLYVVFSIIS